MHSTEINISQDSLYCTEQSINLGIRGNMKLVRHPGTNAEDMSSADIKTNDSHIDLTDNCIKEVRINDSFRCICFFSSKKEKFFRCGKLRVTL